MSRFDRHRDPGRRQFVARQPAKVSAYNWQVALHAAEGLARTAEDELASCLTQFHDELMTLRATVADLSPEAFPLASLPARQLAAGWISWARAFSNPELSPEARTACAPVLAAASKHIGDLVAAYRAAQGRASSRVTGERDED